MKTKISLLSMLFCIVTLSITHAEKNFDINNDLFYEQIKASATEIHQQQLDDNQQLIIDSKTFYNDAGFATKGLTQISGITIKSDYEAYKNHQRITTLSSTHVTKTLKTVWSSPYNSHASDGDMFSDYTFNEEGYVTHQKIFFENESELTEVMHFYYFNDENEATLQSARLINNLKAGEKLTIITDLERDNHGSWIKRKEVTSDGVITIYARTITYTESI